MAESFLDTDQKEAPAGYVIDFKRVLSRAIRYWWVVVGSLLISLFVAFYINRYSPRIYPVNASILIRETQETTSAEFLYKNGLVDQYRNYLNEPYIIRSYPLIEKVVRDLNFQITFYQEGYIVTSETYGNFPVKAVACNPTDTRTGKFSFKLVDADHFEIGTYDENDEKSKPEIFKLGDSISYLNYRICISRIMGKKINPHIGVPYVLSIQNPVSVAGSYIARLSVEWAEQGAGIINLGLTGDVPQKEIDFMNALIVTYQAEDLKKKNEAATRTVSFIQKQLELIKDSLRQVEYDLGRFGSKGREEDMSAEAKRLMDKFDDIELQRAQLLLRRNYFDYLAGYRIREDANTDQIILPSAVGISDPILNNLLTKITDLQMEMKVHLDPELMRNPIVMEERRLKTEKISAAKSDVDEAVRTLRETDNVKMNFLDKQIKEYQNQLDLLPDTERKLISVRRNYSLLENLYVFLMQKSSEAKISEAANTPDIVPVNPPMRGGAISPKTGKNYTTAIIAGIALPLLVFIILELFNNKVQSREDIDKMTTIPFLGGVGHSSSDTNLIVRARPKSGVAESFRAMRSNLNYFTGNKTKQLFMVSSSISGEGKTFTTINLATVFALSGKETVIVGADMRRPKIVSDFGLGNERGLSTYLSGLSELDDVVQRTEIDNLFLISGGPVPPNPSELLLTDRFETFINGVRDRFDYVIIDTPPLALVTDAFVISKFADHTIFVLRQNYSPKEFVKSIDEYYRSGKLKSMSIMLNDIYKSGLGYGYGQGYAYQYGYSYGYGYGSKKDGGGYYEE
ncbi:MAG: polysaccharide biosynthesis tyrosine autokinase [Bacteroidetes bacterium]|nr:polysaccharide biosynthesis tyrosine autokinase [Bacteroidota bacterium]